MRNTIKCPRCLLDGREKTIAEILPDGTIAIQRQRSKYSYEEATLIQGNDFKLACGYCRTIVFIKKEVSDAQSSNIRPIWVHRISFNNGTFIQEVRSGESNTGTPVLTN